MAVKVRVFGILRSIVGSEELQVQHFEKLEELLDHLRKDFPEINRHNFVVAINQQVVNENEDINDGDEIALMPPFAGG